MNLDPDIQKMLDERKNSMQFFSSDHVPMNMYCIFRADLQMPPGKMSAQAGHAFDITHDKAKLLNPDIAKQYKGSGNGTKICMYTKNLNQLIKAYRLCIESNICCELIIDRGHVLPPHFDGNPIITCLGIGPVFKHEIAHITKKFTMLS